MKPKQPGLDFSTKLLLLTIYNRNFKPTDSALSEAITLWKESGCPDCPTEYLYHPSASFNEGK